MKKLLGIVVLGLLLSGCSKKEVANLKCINKNGGEGPFILTIDLNKKIMNAGGTEYKIKKVDETEIYGVVKNRNENFNIWFNRFSAEITFIKTARKQKGENTKILNTSNYKCEKIEKVL